MIVFLKVVVCVFFFIFVFSYPTHAQTERAGEKMMALWQHNIPQSGFLHDVLAHFLSVGSTKNRKMSS